MVERRAPEPVKEFEYPTVDNFDPISWLNLTRRNYYMEKRNDSPLTLGDNTSEDDVVGNLQFGIEPAAPLARLQQKTPGGEKTWYLTRYGWIREPFSEEHLTEHVPLADDIIPPAKLNELKKRRFIGRDEEVTEAEVNDLIKTLVNTTWKDTLELGLTEDLEEFDDDMKKRVFVDALYRDEDEPAEPFAAECSEIVDVLPKKLEPGDSVVVGGSQALIIVQGQNKSDYIVGLPTYKYNRDIRYPDSIDYFSVRDNRLWKRTKKYNPGTEALSAQTIREETGGFWDEESPVEDVNPIEQAYVLDYVAENGKTMSTIKTALQWARSKPFDASKNARIGNERFRITMRSSEDPEGVVMTHLIEDYDARAGAGDKLPASGALSMIYSTGHRVDPQVQAIIVMTMPESNRVRLMEKGYEDMDPETFKEQIRRIKTFTDTESARQLLANSFPPGSKLGLETSDLYNAVSHLPSLLLATKRMR